MIKHYVYINSASILSIKHSQLIITNRDSGEIKKVPIEEILVLELDSPEISLNNYLLGELAVNNVVLLIDRMHMPIGTLQPFYANSIHTKRFNYQLSCTQRTKNRLWQFLVQGKIKHQANVLDARNKRSIRLHKLFSVVLTGDKGNKEAQAAGYYWKELMGKDFVRQRTGEFPNILLNYGYAIIRSAMARALAAAGFHPALGFKHRNQYNPFCLADDMMEPYRPVIDINVYDFTQEYPEQIELEKETKKFLISVLYSDIEIDGEKSNLQEAIIKTAQSLIKSFEDNKNQLLLPDICT